MSSWNTEAGLARARELYLAREQQIALIAIAARNAAARQARAPVQQPMAPAPATETPPAGMTEQVRRLGIWRQVTEVPNALPRVLGDKATDSG